MMAIALMISTRPRPSFVQLFQKKVGSMEMTTIGMTMMRALVAVVTIATMSSVMETTVITAPRAGPGASSPST